MEWFIINNFQNLFDYEIKRGKDILYNFSFMKNNQDNYRICYNLYFDKVEKYFKKDELGTIAKGYIARIMSGFHNEFKIKPMNEKQGFDFSIDVEFKGNIDENLFIERFKDYKNSLETILKKMKIILTRENINVIIDTYSSIDNTVENLIVLDSKTNKVYHINKNIDKQNSNTLGIYLTDRDILEIERMKKPIIIHNHKNNLTFSKEDYVVYEKLKKIINKKFLFMVYSIETQELKEINTNTIFS